MNSKHSLAALAMVAGAFATPSHADGRQPGSVLIYTVQRSGPDFFTIVSVTNTNTLKASPNNLGGTTDVHYEYVNANPSGNPLRPDGCNIVDRVETLTPADTLSVLTTCHNAFTPGGQMGYLVVSALQPSGASLTTWEHDWLVGSEMVVNASGVVYSLNAIPFTAAKKKAPANVGDGAADPTDGILMFDDMEYESAPEALIIDSFVAVSGSHLTLLNLTGGDRDVNKIRLVAYNDNEFQLSDTFEFNCWFDQPLTDVSQIFQESFLKSTVNDPTELDISCTGDGRLETGWVLIDSISVKTPGGSLLANDGVVLGSITAGEFTNMDGGRLLWETSARQSNGAFPNP